MDKRLTRRGAYAVAAALVAGGVGAAFAVAGAGGAPGASTAPSALTAAALAAASDPGWRITQVLPNVAAGGLWAGGARDAWLAGDECADPATCGATDESAGTLVIRHWDGTAWRVVTPPTAYVDSDLDQGAEAVVATSAANAWIFAGRGLQQVDYTDALHWTGHGWARPVRIGDTMVQAAAGAAGQVWAFGTPLAYGQVGLFAHYNGKSWTHGSFPVNGTAATFMRSDAAPAVQKCSSSQFGICEVDGTSITAAGGVISAAVSSSYGSPGNYDAMWNSKPRR